MSNWAGILITLLCSVALTVGVRAFARRKGVVAKPRKDRWHQKPTALLGGISIYAAFAAGYLLFAPSLPIAYPVLAAGTLLFFVGLVDDVVQLKPYTKLVAQVIAAAGVVYSGGRLAIAGNDLLIDLLTIFWLVGITNAVNLLDNMDGLAGGVSVISCVFLVVALYLGGQPDVALLPALLGAAILGFLVFNFNPASIFMGDCGSMFLGFMLGGTALLSYGRLRSMTAVLITPVLILLVPILDTCLVTATRLLSGKRVSQGGRDHTSHRLVALGMSERRAVLVLYLLSALAGVLAMMLHFLSLSITLMIVPGFALIFLLIGLYLGKVKVYEEGEQPEGNGLIRVLADISYKRRVFEVLLDFALLILAYYGAYLLRFEGEMPEQQLPIFIKTAPLLALIGMAIFWFGGVYRGLWRYAGMDDLITIARSVLAYTVLGALTVFTIYDFTGPSRAVFILNGLLVFLFMGASRLSFRLLPALFINPRRRGRLDGKPVLIYGAGDGGALLIREILNNPAHFYLPVGFIDDDSHKEGKLMHGYRIFNSRALPDLVARHGVNEVLVSSGKVTETNLDRLRDQGLCLRRMTIRIE